ncbi:MAG: hypothetical protein GIX03_07635 [Candidatus Eremiobacteraeota bacterium]|nr:hypothetical protein [Candidatus Eremiobacteraeota bacterium]
MQSSVVLTAASGAKSSSSVGTPVASLPVYPDATKVAIPPQMKRLPAVCGRGVSMTLYDLKGSIAATTVEKWYQDRISGGIEAKTSEDAGGIGGTTSYEIFIPDGTGSVSISQFHSGHSGGSEKDSVSKFYTDIDKTNIGLETYNPPLSPDLIALFQQGTSGDSSAKQAAQHQLKAKCGDPGANDGK